MNLAQPLPFTFNLATLPAETNRLRTEVRDFLAREIEAIPFEKRAQSWSGFDPASSRARRACG